MPIESLNIEDYRLKTSLIGREHVVYLLKVCFTSSSEVIVWRRFREFKRLHNRLRNEFPGQVMPSSFPSSDWSLFIDEKLIFKRRFQLQDYLQDLKENDDFMKSPSFLLFISNDQREFYPPEYFTRTLTTIPPSINPSINVDLLRKIKSKNRIINEIFEIFLELNGKILRENANISNVSNALHDLIIEFDCDSECPQTNNTQSPNQWELALKMVKQFSTFENSLLPKCDLQEIMETFKIREICRKKLLHKQTLEINSYNNLMNECNNNINFDRAYGHNLAVLKYRSERERVQNEFAIIEDRLFINLTKIEEEKEKIIKNLVDHLRKVIEKV